MGKGFQFSPMKPSPGGTPHTSARRRQRTIVALCALAALFWMLRKVAALQDVDYILVIDAGSSGTRMFAYECHMQGAEGAMPHLAAIPPHAAPHKIPRRALENRRAYMRVETEPGLDSHVGNMAGVQGKALEPLLEWARAVVPRRAWADTPLFLLATAGMRRLRASDQRTMLEAIRATLAGSGFRFEAPWAKIISGEDEGVFGWVALNHAAGRLGTQRTLGSLDLGGSSLEVTFAAEGREGGALPEGVNVSIPGATHSLYVQSHNHFGLNDAFERSVQLLLEQGPAARAGQKKSRQKRPSPLEEDAAAVKGAIRSSKSSTSSSSSEGGAPPKEQGGAAAIATAALRRRSLQQQKKQQGAGSALPQVDHPCMHAGFRQHYDRLPLGGRTPVPDAVLLVGRPDAAACARLISAVATAATSCSSPPCTLGGPLPAAAGSYVALTGFYVVHHFFGLAPTAGMAALEAAGAQFCKMPWADVQEQHPGELAVEAYCFRAGYVQALLHQGLGLKEEQVEIGDAGAGWTLGAALVEGGRVAALGSAHQRLRASQRRWAVMIGRLPGILLGIAAVLLLVSCWSRCRPLLLRAVRSRLLAESSDDLPMTRSLSAASLVGIGGTSSSNLLLHVLGGANAKKAGSPAAGGSPANWAHRNGQNGMGMARSLSRSQTFGRRLSALVEPDR